MTEDELNLQRGDQLRDLLAFIGRLARLPHGGLGVAFVGVGSASRVPGKPPATVAGYQFGYDNPVFVEEVNRDAEVKEIAKDRMNPDSKYKLHNEDAIIKALKQPAERVCRLTKSDAFTTKGRGGDYSEVWENLVKLFGSPDQISDPVRLFRCWLLKKKSALYFLPVDPNYAGEEWDFLIDPWLRSIIARLLRQTISLCGGELHDTLVSCLPSVTTPNLKDRASQARDTAPRSARVNTGQRRGRQSHKGEDSPSETAEWLRPKAATTEAVHILTPVSKCGPVVSKLANQGRQRHYTSSLFKLIGKEVQGSVGTQDGTQVVKTKAWRAWLSKTTTQTHLLKTVQQRNKLESAQTDVAPSLEEIDRAKKEINESRGIQTYDG